MCIRDRLIRRDLDRPPDDQVGRLQWGEWLYRGADLEFIDNHLEPATTYFYLACALDAEGCASEATIVDIHTPASFRMLVRLHNRVTGTITQTAWPEDAT